jgi:hypothetical protein
MKWYGHEILYKVKLSNNQEIFVEIKDIQKHNNNNMYNNLFEIKSLDKDRLSLKLTNSNYYYELTNGELYILKKNIILPKTYGECCDILGIDDRVYITNTWNLNHEPIIDDYNVSLTGELNELRRLINCRNAYWKLLDYNPEYKEFEDNQKYTIYTFNNKILKSSTLHGNAILSFPTEEIMNVFYENFKDIIERCKNYL